MIYRYEHPELFADWEKPDFKQHSGRLILYGAGRRGMVAAHCLKNLGVDFLCFCDSDPKKHGNQVCGYPVISPQELRKEYPQNPILITTSLYYYLKEELASWGYKEVFNCVSLFFEIDFDGFNEDFSVEYMCRNTDLYFSVLSYPRSSDNFLADLMFPVTLRCTLRCRECNVYTPYVTHPVDFDFERMIESVDKLLGAYKDIHNISILGGEPFLYARLPELVQDFTSRQHIKKLTLITNGTLLPNAELLTALTHPKVRIRISDYGALSIKKEQLIATLKEKDIFTEITKFGYWNLTPTVDILNETKEQLRKKFLNCCGVAKTAVCINGKMFFCVFSGFYDYLKAVPDFGDNYVELLNFKGSGTELRNAINQIRMIVDGLPQKACRYCNFDHLAQHLPVAEQTTETFQFKKVY